MTALSDRKTVVANATEAIATGARQDLACREAGLSARTYRRWTKSGEICPDGRPDTVRPTPSNKLSDEERAEILTLRSIDDLASLPPPQIGPRLADQGRYVASESSFYRVPRDHDQLRHQGRAKAPIKRNKPISYQATGPNQVWSWEFGAVREAMNGPG